MIITILGHGIHTASNRGLLIHIRGEFKSSVRKTSMDSF